MADQNVLALTGRLTREPELRSTQGGESVCHFRLASNGVRDDDTVYVDVSVWGKQGVACQQYLHTGARVAVNGVLGVREWTGDDQVKRTNVECNSARVSFLETKAEAEAHAAPPPVAAAAQPVAAAPVAQPAPQQQPQQLGQQPPAAQPPPADDDDIPF